MVETEAVIDLIMKLRRTDCERCGGDISVRAFSWFTLEVICGACWEKENILRRELNAQRKDLSALEGCGYVPKLKKSNKAIGGARPKQGK